MSELSDTITEAAEQGGRNRIHALVAICVAITATFMALCNVKDGNIVQAMQQAQARYIDGWSYFQAKSTKQSMAENTLALLKTASGDSAVAGIKKYTAEIARYDR